MTSDSDVRRTIHDLVEREKHLRDSSPPDPAELRSVEEELDQCWDLLRQRQALREYGGDPSQAQVRPPGVVENYRQ